MNHTWLSKHLSLSLSLTKTAMVIHRSQKIKEPSFSWPLDPNNPQSNMQQASLFPSYPAAKICIFALLWKCVEESGWAIVCQE